MKKILFIFLIIAGCDTKDDPGPALRYEIDPLLSTEVNAFYSEAGERGYTFENENLIVRAIPSGTTISRYEVKNGQRIVEVLVLDPSTCQELPVFREMARALLDEPYISSGDAIMNPDTHPCIYVHIPTGEFKPEREDFINQLFQ